MVLNKCLEGEDPAEIFCIAHNIPILGRIPFDQELGHLNSNSQIVSRLNGKYKDIFAEILQQIKEATVSETAIDSER